MRIVLIAILLLSCFHPKPLLAKGHGMGGASPVTSAAIVPGDDPLHRDHHPVVKIEITGDFDNIRDDAQMRDLLFRMLLELRPALKYEDVHWLVPHVEGKDLVFDLVDGRANVDAMLYRLGRYRVNKRARTFHALLTVYN